MSAPKLTLPENTRFAIDFSGVAVQNTINGKNCFIRYPEAAIWLVLANGHSLETACVMISAITGNDNMSCETYVNHHLQKWHYLLSE